MQRIAEVEHLHEDAPVRQGDVLAFAGSMVGKFGVVVTADCDIAQSKSDESLSYVPIIGLAEYITDTWARRKLEKLKALRIRDTGNFIQKHRLRLDPEAKPLSGEALAHWISTRSCEDITNAISLTDPKDYKKFLQAHFQPLQCLLGGHYADRQHPHLSTLCKVRNLISGDTPEAVLKQASTEISSQMPQDCFFISEIPANPVVRGAVALLREIRQIEQQTITTSLLEFKEGTRPAMRIGRLASPYKFALVQQLALLF